MIFILFLNELDYLQISENIFWKMFTDVFVIKLFFFFFLKCHGNHGEISFYIIKILNKLKKNKSCSFMRNTNESIVYFLQMLVVTSYHLFIFVLSHYLSIKRLRIFQKIFNEQRVFRVCCQYVLYILMFVFLKNEILSYFIN